MQNFATPNKKSAVQQKDNIKVIGHRGFAGCYPENSLLGIRKALQLGVDRIEIDIHQSKDEKIIVIHDSTIDRTTDGKGMVRDHTYEELSKFPLYHQSDSISQQFIPSLEQVLEMVEGKSNLLIEIKHGDELYPGLLDRLLQLIDQHNAGSWCIIQSFNSEILKKIHATNPNIRIHKLLLSSWFYDLDELPFVSEFSISYYFLSKKLVRQVHAMDKKVNVWTVNSASKMHKAIKLGVDGIITDRPDLLKLLL